MKPIAILLVALLVGAGTLQSFAAKVSESTPVAIPATLALEPPKHATAELVVIVKNPEHESVSKAELKLISRPGIKAEELNAPIKGTKEDLVWRVRVTADRGAPASSELVLQVDWQSATAESLKSSGAAAVTITSKDAPTPAHALTARLEPDNFALDETRSQQLSLFLDNTSTQSIKINEIKVVSQPWLELCDPAA
jgi:hypothetical protein